MAGYKIDTTAGGTGVFTIATPNSNSDRVLTLPDEAGTVLTSASDLTAANLTGDVAAARITDALNASGSAPVYACRAWVNFNGTGTVAIRASGNVSSITDNGTGDYTVNFTTAMPDANYAVSWNSGSKSVTWGLPLFVGLSGPGNTDSHSTTQVRVQAVTPSDVGQDNAQCDCAVFR
jgi:hypothetical protein